MSSDDKIHRADDKSRTDGSAEDTESVERALSRRFVIKAGLAAAPVFLTLRGLPARASSPGMGSLGDYDYGGGPGPGGRGQDPREDWDRDDRRRRDQYQKGSGAPGGETGGDSNRPSTSR